MTMKELQSGRPSAASMTPKVGDLGPQPPQQSSMLLGSLNTQQVAAGPLQTTAAYPRIDSRSSLLKLIEMCKQTSTPLLKHLEAQQLGESKASHMQQRIRNLSLLSFESASSALHHQNPMDPQLFLQPPQAVQPVTNFQGYFQPKIIILNP